MPQQILGSVVTACVIFLLGLLVLSEPFAAEAGDASAGQPFGVKYSLVLLSKDGRRLIGYDNSHGYAEHRKTEWDHRHEEDVVTPYEYTSAGQLLEDFWADVDRRLSDET